MLFDREALTQAFLEESAEGLSFVEAALIALETRPADDETLRAIFRQVHTLKGNSASLQLAWLTELTHALEDLLDRLCAGTLALDQGMVSLILQAVDALRDLVPRAAAGSEERRPSEERLLASLCARAAEASEPSRGTTAPADHGGASTLAAPPPDDPGHVAIGQRLAKRTLRVDIDRLDRMLNLIGELVIARGRVAHAAVGLGPSGVGVAEAHHAADQLCMDLQEQIIQARMVPIGPLFDQYARIVRDTAVAQCKLARLVIEGGDVEIDATIIERMRDPLTHMVRNALDHGIEPPEVRKSKGKDPCGVLMLRAIRDRKSVLVEVADDGAGLQRDHILKRARELDLAVGPEELSDQELHRLIFEPGFSTADSVTTLSGRGVGMDVVRRNVEELRGSITITSREGEGTTITARLPLTVALIDGFLVGAAGETYVIPLDDVCECAELPADSNRRHDRGGILHIRGQPLPYVRLRHLFGLGGEPGRREEVVVVRDGEGRAGISVDSVLGDCQIVIKPLGALFERVPAISGATILGSGQVGLILDVPGVLEEAVKRTTPTGMGS